jgi:hypothetical protein
MVVFRDGVSHPGPLVRAWRDDIMNILDRPSQAQDSGLSDGQTVMTPGNHARFYLAMVAAKNKWASYYLWIFYPSVLLVVVIIYRDFGVGLDERFQAMNGILSLNYILHGDQAYHTYMNLRFYGPLFDTLSATILFPLWFSDPKHFYLFKHLLTALCGVLSAIGVHQAAKLISNRLASWVPAFAATTVLLMPRFFGDMFHNPKDIPFACAFIWAVVFCLKCLRDRSIKHFAIAGFFVGLAIDIRIGGILLIPAFLVPVLWDTRHARTPQRAEEATRVTAHLTIFIAVCVLTVYVFWPYLWRSPFDRFYKAFRVMSKFSWRDPVLFEGRQIISQDLPWYYLAKWLVISLPEWIVVCAILGFGSCLMRSKAIHRSSSVFVALAFCIPFVWLSLPGRTIYDGVRQFLFGHTLIALFSAIGLGTALTACRRIARPLALMGVMLIGVNLYDLVAYHPYQSIYFNRMSGGIQAAKGRYETDYWALSYRRAIEWMNDHLSGPARLTIWGTSLPGELFLDKNRFTLTDISNHPDYYLSVTRWDKHLSVPGRPIHAVELQGVPLSFLLKTQ